MNYKEAVSVGAKRYSNGKPCSRGHLSERLVSTRSCIECELLRKKEWASTNRAKISKQVKSWRKRNPGRKSASDRKFRTGFSPELFAALLEIQGNACAICLKPFGILHSARPNADHCHSTNKPRGALCTRCNTVLGKMCDDVQSIKRMVAYLENPPANSITHR
jgi:hypothetical protein